MSRTSESELSDATEISTIGTSNWNLHSSDGNSDANSQESITASQAQVARNLIVLQEVHGVVIPETQAQPEINAAATETETGHCWSP